ncbi:Uma2 family endonuclease [Actinomycetota bacterium Odt1-20B]
MTRLPRTDQEVYRHLREYRDQLGHTPGIGWGEITDGRLVMMMSPKAQHQLIGAKIRRGLEPQLADDLMLMVATDMEDAGLGVLRVPDLAVFNADARPTDADALAAVDCHLVVEIVSRSNASNDYEGKLADYPAMGIPHYVIVDPRDGTAVHYWAPSQRTGRPAYDNRQRYQFGDTITVNEWKIDTSTLPLYRKGEQ